MKPSIDRFLAGKPAVKHEIPSGSVPAPGADGVAVSSQIKISFSAPLDTKQKIKIPLQLREYSADPQSPPLHGRISLANSRRSFIFTPNEPLKQGTRYKVRILPGVSIDKGNIETSEWGFAFTTAYPVVPRSPLSPDDPPDPPMDDF